MTSLCRGHANLLCIIPIFCMPLRRGRCNPRKVSDTSGYKRNAFQWRVHWCMTSSSASIASMDVCENPLSQLSADILFVLFSCRKSSGFSPNTHRHTLPQNLWSDQYLQPMELETQTKALDSSHRSHMDGLQEKPQWQTGFHSPNETIRTRQAMQ